MRLFALIALSGMAAASVARADLVNNGGFETGDLTGWSAAGDFTYTGVNASPNIHSGNFAFDMGPVNGEGSISQNLSTVAGQTYQFSFWLANDGGIPNNFHALWNGAEQLGLTDANGFGYTQYSYNVTATGASTTIEFDFYQLPAWYHLDDVSVTSAVPLPPAAAMGIGGMAGIGMIGAIRRRRTIRG